MGCCTMNHLKLPAHYLELYTGVLKLSSLMDYINKPPTFLGSSGFLVYKEDQNEVKQTIKQTSSDLRFNDLNLTSVPSFYETKNEVKNGLITI